MFVSKKIVFAILSVLTASFVGVGNAISAEDNSQKTTSQIKDYSSFPKDMILAFSQCSPYFGAITNTNPYWDGLRKAGRKIPSEEIKILGPIKIKGEVKCRFFKGFALENEKATYHDCLIDNQRKQRLVKAMQDRSGKIYSDTVQIETKEADGKSDNNSGSEVLKGTLYQVTMAKIITSDCKEVNPEQIE